MATPPPPYPSQALGPQTGPHTSTPHFINSDDPPGSDINTTPTGTPTLIIPQQPVGIDIGQDPKTIKRKPDRTVTKTVRCKRRHVTEQTPGTIHDTLVTMEISKLGDDLIHNVTQLHALTRHHIARLEAQKQEATGGPVRDWARSPLCCSTRQVLSTWVPALPDSWVNAKPELFHSIRCLHHPSTNPGRTPASFSPETLQQIAMQPTKRNEFTTPTEYMALLNQQNNWLFDARCNKPQCNFWCNCHYARRILSNPNSTEIPPGTFLNARQQPYPRSDPQGYICYNVVVGEWYYQKARPSVWTAKGVVTYFPLGAILPPTPSHPETDNLLDIQPGSTLFMRVKRDPRLR